jgi:hypothetical protein
MEQHRPRDDDAAVLDEAAEQTLICLEPWLELHKHDQSFEAEKVRRDVHDALAQHYDGYPMAKYLETSAGWAVNAALVQILEGATEFRKAALWRATRAWVAATKLMPKHKIGDAVVYAGKPGTIRGIQAENGLYEFERDENVGRLRRPWTEDVPFEDIDRNQPAR